MPTPIEHILLRDEWTEADRLVLRRALEADPELGPAVRRWVALCRAAATQWDEGVPSRHALVLLACRNRFHPDDLTDEERVLLDDASAALDTALERHPAVSDVLERIRHEADAFDRAWSRSFEDKDASPRSAADRGPLRRASGSPSGPLRLVRLAVAAAAVIAILFVGRSWFGADIPGPTATYSAAATMQVVSLDDGSEIRLAPRSTLEVLYDEESDERRVRLIGDGFFDVAAGPRPFRVETANALTTVLGTSFGVRTANGTDVFLVTGRVSLASADDPGSAVVLAPGEQGTLAADADMPSVRTFATLDGFDWSGLLVFRNTPMASVAERLSEEFDVAITVSDDLKEAPLTGTFESERGSKAILDIIASALGARVTEQEDGSFLLSRPAE